MAQSISKQPLSTKQKKLKSRNRFLAEAKSDLLFNKSRPPPKKSHKGPNGTSKREKKRQMNDSKEFPGLKNIATPEALALTPGEGILQFYKERISDEENEADKLVSGISVSSEPKEIPNKAEEEDSGFISLDAEDESAMGKQFKEIEREDSRFKNQFPSPWIGNEGQVWKNMRVGECMAAEVLDFLRYMNPTKAEIKKRDECVVRLRRVVKQLWPDASVQVFGSYATGMYLPDADIDVVIMSSKMRARLRSEMFRLSSRLRSNNIAQSVNVISHARVPIIKYVEAGSGINVDVAFSQSGGIDTVNRVSGWLDANKALKPLAMVIRQFLKRRNLSDAATGGLGGYATLCLVYSRLQQLTEEIKASPLRNLGILLLDFFDFYGHTFDNTTKYVRPQPHPRCNPLAKKLNGSMATQQAVALAIEDPNDNNNNISKATYNYPTIKRSFGNAADYLKSLCYAWHTFTPAQKAETSFLAPLLKFDGSESVRSKQTLERSLSIIRLQKQPPSPSPEKPQTKPARRRSYSSEKNEVVEKGKGVASFDPFQSEDQDSDVEVIETRAKKPDGQSRASKRSSRGSDDEDSRTKLTTAQRRQFWNRKSGTPEGQNAQNTQNTQNTQNNQISQGIPQETRS